MIYNLLALAIITAWFVNGYKFVSCDFESNYRCEVIHAAGVAVPPFSLATVWFGSDT